MQLGDNVTEFGRTTSVTQGRGDTPYDGQPLVELDAERASRLVDRDPPRPGHLPETLQKLAYFLATQAGIPPTIQETMILDLMASAPGFARGSPPWPAARCPWWPCMRSPAGTCGSQAATNPHGSRSGDAFGQQREMHSKRQASDLL